MMCRLSTLLISIAAMLLMGCASHPVKVNCEGTVRPINPPAPAVHSDGPAHEG
jgi:hypothetical protein